MTFYPPLRVLKLLCFFLQLTLLACSSGTMTVREVQYFAIPNGENTNYYRLRVEANTQLGKAEYRSGWFPSRSLEMLFGDVSSEGGVGALKVQSALEEQINEKIISTNAAWLEEAMKANPDTELLGRLLKARKRVLAYPSGSSPHPEAFEIEYNPGLGVAIRHADEKLVFLLTSDPDDVINRIAGFTEDAKTVLVIEQLSQVVAQRMRNEISAQEAKNNVADKLDTLVVAQIESALQVLATPQPSKEAMLQQIDMLLFLLESLQP